MLKPGVETIIAPSTAKEKAQRRLELKARSTLLMGIPNEHQLGKFKLCQRCSRRCCLAIEKRFGGNAATKKIIGIILKQRMKFYLSSSERNNPEIDTLRLDDLYNNLKIYELEVKGTSSSSSNTQNVAFVSSKSTSNTNGAVNTAHGATTASTQVAGAYANIGQARFLKNMKNAYCLRYNAVLPPYTGNFMPPKLDLSFSGLEEFMNEPIVSEPTVKKHVDETSEVKASADKPKAVKKNNGVLIIKDWVSDSEEEDMPQAKIQKKTVKLSFAKIEFVKSKDQYDCNNHQRQLNNKKIVKPAWNYTQRVNHQNFSRMTHPSPKRNMIPKAVLIRPKAVVLAAKPKRINVVKENQDFAVDTQLSPFKKAVMKTSLRIARCDNGTEFKNKEMNQFCERKGIKREFSVARTPQQNGVAERKNRTLIEAARTMLADSKLPTTFWAEAVNTACYVQNRVLVTKPHNKTPYELFLGRKPALGFMRPFGCPVTILNTIDHLGKFDGKADEGFFIGYSINSKAFRLFDIDALTKSMNYKPVVTGNQSNDNAGTKACDDAGKARMETVPGKDYILLPLWTADPPFSQCSKSSPDAGFKLSGDNEKKVTKEIGKEGGDPSNEGDRVDKEKNDSVNNTNNINTASDGNSTNNVNTISSTVYTAGIKVNDVSSNTRIELLNDPIMPELEDIVYSDDFEDVGAETDMNNLNTFMLVIPMNKLLET
ncbi:ribonuclease H-like domain-containing protein [Tanacetum coccineum]